MKHTYLRPEMTEFGSIAALTGIFGSSVASDVLVNQNGQVVQTGDLSINACATLDFNQCQAQPS